VCVLSPDNCRQQRTAYKPQQHFFLQGGQNLLAGHTQQPSEPDGRRPTAPPPPADKPSHSSTYMPVCDNAGNTMHLDHQCQSLASSSGNPSPSAAAKRWHNASSASQRPSTQHWRTADATSRCQQCHCRQGLPLCCVCGAKPRLPCPDVWVSNPSSRNDNHSSSTMDNNKPNRPANKPHTVHNVLPRPRAEQTNAGATQTNANKLYAPPACSRDSWAN
jgi:hypothetical protein